MQMTDHVEPPPAKSWAKVVEEGNLDGRDAWTSRLYDTYQRTQKELDHRLEYHFGKFWIQHRDYLLSLIPEKILGKIPGQMRIIYGGHFFYNKGSYHIEAEAVLALYEVNPTQLTLDGINPHHWAHSTLKTFLQEKQ